MPHSPFKTVSDNLIEFAESAYSHFVSRGFKVWREKFEIGFPYTPTLICKREHTRIIVEVFGKLKKDKVEQWIAYARSTRQDIRISVCLPFQTDLIPEELEYLRKAEVGIYVGEQVGMRELIAPRDLGMTLMLPPITTLPFKLRIILGSAYDQYDRAQWRECFDEACRALENQVRHYLIRGSKSGRIKLATKKGSKILSTKEINKYTIGRLAQAFSQIQNRNYTDTMIERTLCLINKDRIGFIHHKTKKRTETRLRANVGQNMWSIVGTLKQMMA